MSLVRGCGKGRHSNKRIVRSDGPRLTVGGVAVATPPAEHARQGRVLTCTGNPNGTRNRFSEPTSGQELQLAELDLGPSLKYPQPAGQT